MTQRLPEDLPEDAPGLIDTATLAEWLGLRPQTIRYWRVQKIGPRYVRLGSRASIRYLRGDVAQWLKSSQWSPR